jgi:hypothetical protein
MREFETAIWNQPAFARRAPPDWNLEDIGPFWRWHRQTAAHHNYVTGAAVLQKEAPRSWWRIFS